MASRRTSKRSKEINEERKDTSPEPVLMIQSSIGEDDVLNANTSPTPPKSETEGKLPRPDDPDRMEKLPEWIGDAINSGEDLQVTDDPSMVGKKKSSNEREFLDTSKEVSPLQGELNDLNATRLEKKELLSRAKFLNASLSEERKFYSEQRKRRAIPILELPSNNKLYPEDVRISYSPYSVQDLEDINNNDVPIYQKYLIMLEGIHTIGMSSLELTFSDFTFISDVRHLQAMGEVYFKYPYVCSSCGRAGVYQFTLNEVSFASLKRDMPIHVRFHTFPDEVFLFAPHTIGDVLHLIKTDKYWRKIGEEYLTSEDGRKMIDLQAINACRCLSHPWEDAYIKMLEASENPEDRRIMKDINEALYHDSEPLRFKCKIPLDRSAREQMSEVTSDLVKGIVSGEISTITPNRETRSVPPWMKAHLDNPSSPEKARLKECGAYNEIDVLAGDIIVPFFRYPVDMEYGIISG